MKRPDIPSLTGLRFLAAATIVYNHTAGEYFLPDKSVLGDFWHVSLLGMTLFFVLSGFVIHYNYGAVLARHWRSGVRDFAVARLARLYPLYLLALLAMFAFPNVVGGQFTGSWFWYVTGTQAWLPIKGGDHWIATANVIWSISIEFFLYLLYVPLGGMLAGLSRDRTLLIASILCGAMLILYGGRALHLWLYNLEGEGWWFYFGACSRIPEFLTGAIAAQLYIRQADKKPSPLEWRIASAVALAALCWIAALFFGFMVPALSDRVKLLSVSGGYAWPCAAIMYYAARFGVPLLEYRSIVGLGNASYSMYLLHGWILFLFASQGIGTGLLFWAKIAASWLFIVALSLGAYTYFEVPARAFIRRAPSLLFGLSS